MNETALDPQFYPTPPALARRMWNTFDPRFAGGRLLEPSAGDGALLKARWRDDAPEEDRFRYRKMSDIDVIEIDEARRALLDERFNVVGSDFLNFAALEKYGRILMNPPFNAGAEHVLHAWDGLVEGQIVAIVNAETLRNPFCAQRKRLARLVRQYGHVEYIAEGFIDAQRETAVEVALISLIKLNGRDSQLDSVKHWLITSQDDDEAQYDAPPLTGTEVANLNRYVEEQVETFQSTINLIKKMASLDALRRQMLARLGQSFTAKYGGDKQEERYGKRIAAMDQSIAEQIADARERAWLAVMDSTGVDRIASFTMKEKIHASIAEFVKVPFTVDKVNAFLESVLQSAPAMLSSVLDAGFDAFSRYSSQNCVCYRGWRSNDKHRAFGMKLKSTRFIIANVSPYHRYDKQRDLGEFLRAMRYLDDGTLTPLGASGLGDVRRCEEAFSSPGERIEGEYADFRYFRGTQTLHIFPRRKDLVEKLNLDVARRRQWLPPTDAMGHCWRAAFDAAERTEKDIAAIFGNITRNPVHTAVNSPELVVELAKKVDAYYIETGIWDALPSCSDPSQGSEPTADALPLLEVA
jgi:Domain of unknown function (DUF4942)